jgi:hypothetical protein
MSPYFGVVLLFVTSLAYADRYAVHGEQYGSDGGASFLYLILAVGMFAIFVKWPVRGLCLSGIIAGIAILTTSGAWFIGLPLIAAGAYFLYKIVFVLRADDC